MTGRHGRSLPAPTVSSSPAVVVALQLGLPFRAPRVELLLDSPIVDRLLERATTLADQTPLLVVLGRVRDETLGATAAGRGRAAGEHDPTEVATALLAWAVGQTDLAGFTGRHERPRRAGRASVVTTRRSPSPLPEQ